MGFGFDHLGILAGLAAIVLPVLLHRFHRRPPAVVSWGAMPFLQLGEAVQRRLSLQNLLLLLLRIGGIVCLVLALAQPWLSAPGFFSSRASERQDLVVILDGSGQLAWESSAGTPHAQGIQWISQSLDSLQPGDTISVIDARQVPRKILAAPATEMRDVRNALATIPAPRGRSNLPAAIEEGMRILGMTSNPMRRIVVLTDRDQAPWTQSESHWSRIEELRRQFQVPPDMGVVLLGPESDFRPNLSVGPLELSRRVAVPGSPVTVSSAVRQSGGTGPVSTTVWLEVDGQRVPGKSENLSVPLSGAAAVEFEYTFPLAGDSVLSMVIDPDALPSDDRADGVISIIQGLPVLVVDGDPRRDVTRSESFFVRSAFAASGKSAPWVDALFVTAAELQESHLAGRGVLFLLNVRQLSVSQLAAVQSFVEQGGSLVFAPGDRTDSEFWNGPAASLLLAAPFGARRQAEGDTSHTFLPDSLDPVWLGRFRGERGGDFGQVRFGEWWELLESGDPLVVRPLARFSTGEPAALRRAVGEGAVVQLAFPLDADWSTLPARGDFVSFLHELCFQLAGSQSQRNVDVGTPLVLTTPDRSLPQFVVTGPGVTGERLVSVPGRGESVAMFPRSEIPGVYRFERDGRSGREASFPFVVIDDSARAEFQPLTDADWEELRQHQLVPVQSLDEFPVRAEVTGGRVSVWPFLLVMVLLLLIAESALTRQMVQGGLPADRAAASGD